MSNNIDNKTKEETKWEQIKKHLKNNLTIFKIILIILTVSYIIYILILNKQDIRYIQTGGDASGIDNITEAVSGKKKGRFGKFGKFSPITGGFNMVFGFVNTLFMIFGIVIILILIPTIPIIVLLIICYYIGRRKLWDLRTM